MIWSTHPFTVPNVPDRVGDKKKKSPAVVPSLNLTELFFFPGTWKKKKPKKRERFVVLFLGLNPGRSGPFYTVSPQLFVSFRFVSFHFLALIQSCF